MFCNKAQEIFQITTLLITEKLSNDVFFEYSTVI